MTIITDCAADLTAEDIARYGIKVAPLLIQFPNVELEATSLSPDDFFDRLAAIAPLIPTTTQPSPAIFKKIFDALPSKLSNLCITISSGLSGTANSAKLAAKETSSKHIRVVDSLTLSGGERFQVLAAAMANTLGWGRDAIEVRLGEIQKACEVVFSLETLEYLKRGGRIGRVQGLLASLLRIKPIIKVNKKDGKYDTLSKARSLKKARSVMVEHFSQLYKDAPLWVCVLHGQLASEAQAFAEELQAGLKVAKLEVLRISPVLAVHTGPGVVGAAVVPIALFEDLDRALNAPKA
jgi:DegV family protein with EDD domain